MVSHAQYPTRPRRIDSGDLHICGRGRGVLLAICNTGFGLPPVVVGLILSILLLRHGPLGTLNLRFTPGAMIIGQFVLSLPIIIGLTVVALQQLNSKLRLQIAALGASRWQALWLLGREIRLPLLVAYMAGFGAVISEVGASQNREAARSLRRYLGRVRGTASTRNVIRNQDSPQHCAHLALSDRLIERLRAVIAWSEPAPDRCRPVKARATRDRLRRPVGACHAANKMGWQLLKEGPP